MDHWFKTLPNTAFTPEFQRFMEAFIAEHACVQEDETVFDLLSADELDLGLLNEMTESEPWFHFTLIAVLLMEHPDDAESITEALYDFDTFEYLNESVQGWLDSGGCVLLLETLQAEELSAKISLYNALYKTLPVQYLEMPVYARLFEVDFPLILIARETRLASFGLERMMDNVDALPIPEHFRKISKPELMINLTPGDHAQLVRDLKSVLVESSSESSLFVFKALIEKWIYESVRCALIAGKDKERVIYGAKLSIDAFVDAALSSMISTENVSNDDPDNSIFKRQVLINALAPFPDAVALVRPTKEELLSNSVYLPGTEIHVYGSFIRDLDYCKRDASVSCLSKTLKHLGFSLHSDDITHLVEDRKLLLEGMLVKGQGKSKEVEQWFIKNRTEVSQPEFVHLMSAFDFASISEECLCHIHLYIAEAYIGNNLGFDLYEELEVEIPFPQSVQSEVVKFLIVQEQLNIGSIRALKIKGAALIPYAERLDNKTRRHMLGGDLGL